MTNTFMVCLHDKQYKQKPSESDVKVLRATLGSEKYRKKLTPDSFTKAMIQGQTFAPALFTTDKLSKENWFQQQLFGVDIDDNLTVQEVVERCQQHNLNPMLIYTTFSSTYDNKFRVVFRYENIVTNKAKAQKICDFLADIFPEADTKATKDISRLFYGGKTILRMDENATIALSDEQLDAYTRKTPLKTAENKERKPYTKKEYLIIEAALEVLPVRTYYADSYNEWIDIGHIVKYTLGDDGKELYRGFSKKSGSYNEAEFEVKWSKDLDPKGEIGIGSLIYVTEKSDSSFRETLKNIEKMKFTALDAATEFSRRFGDLFFYNHNDKQFYFWTGTHYEAIDSTSPEFESRIIEVLLFFDIKVNSKNTITDVAYMTKANKLLAPKPEQKSGVINFQNGTVEKDNDHNVKLRNHDKSDGLTYVLPFDYTPGNYPLIEATLKQIIADGEDELAVKCYMAQIGLALLGDTKNHQTIFLYGAPRSGKSTLLRLALLCAGQPDGVFAKEVIFKQDTEGMRARFSFYRNRVVCIDELSEHALNDDTFKNMAAHGGEYFRGMHQDAPQDNVWRPKLFMATNNLQRYSDSSGANKERLLFIECPKHRGSREQDKSLLDKMRVELPQFVYACVAEALNVLKEKGFTVSNRMQRLLDEMDSASDSVKSFVADNIDHDPAGYIFSEDLYAAFRDYCSTYGYQLVGFGRFIHRITAHLGREAVFKGKAKNNLGLERRCLRGIQWQDGKPEMDYRSVPRYALESVFNK